MDEIALGHVLRRVLAVSLCTPLVLASAACGGAMEGAPNPTPITDSGNPQDAGGADSGAGADAADASERDDTGLDSSDARMQDATSDAVEAAASDAGDASQDAVDATLADVNEAAVADADASDPCHPARVMCSTEIPLSCFDASVTAGYDADTPLDAGVLVGAQCVPLCGSDKAPDGGGEQCGVTTNGTTGEAVVVCDLCVTGRRPPGLGRVRQIPGCGLPGRYLARAALLEAASVDAFGILRRELCAHRAPAHLLAAAARAAEDETRHARMTKTLALRHGTEVALPTRRARRRRPRSLEAIAIENVVEGCVRETFGALTAMAQAETARDPEVRAVMSRIAVDETRHAALGWAVASWAEARLGVRGRARIECAKRKAIAELVAEGGREQPRTLQAALGLPGSTRARAMLLELQRVLWA